MDVVVTTFTNPFSFFCVDKGASNDLDFLTDCTTENKLNYSKCNVSDVNHGQYIAVLWKNKWTRGVISLEKQFLIWLIDFGIFLRPDSHTVYVELPPPYQKYASKVFEASVRGVIPVDKIITQDCQIANSITIEWNKGAIETAQVLIKSAKKTYFVPFALLSTKNNDVVLGDLYLEMYDNHLVNIVDELQLWPVFLEVNKEEYIKNLSKFYINRRKHHACLLKPDLVSNIPVMTTETCLVEYDAISVYDVAMSKNRKLRVPNSSSCSEDGSTVLDVKLNGVRDKETYKLTHDEIKKYAKKYVRVHGQECNFLNVIINKLRDLNICERYKDHDLKRVGCGILQRRSIN